MTKNSARPSSSVEEYTQAVQVLDHVCLSVRTCCPMSLQWPKFHWDLLLFEQKLKSTCTGSSSLNSIDASHFMHLMANCSFHDNQSSIILHMDCDLITLTSGFKVTPVNPVPIVPTALSKNLSGPAGAACFMGQPKFGWVMMRFKLLTDDLHFNNILFNMSIAISQVPHNGSDKKAFVGFSYWS